MDYKYANVIIDISTEKLDRTFQYKIPDHLKGTLTTGMQVDVPFGKGSTVRKGRILELTNKNDWPPEKLKEILSVDTSILGIQDQLLELARWIHRNYGGTMAQAIRTVLPVKKKVEEKQKRYVVSKLLPSDGTALLKTMEQKNQTARARLMRGLLEAPVIPYEIVTGKLFVTPAVLRWFVERGYIEILSEQEYRTPIAVPSQRGDSVILNQEQAKAVEKIKCDLAEGKRPVYLLKGVTGSGKTEVYMELIAEEIKKGKQSIVLIPEISLTYQTLLRFCQRFNDRVSVLNSRMSAGERYDQFLRVERGEVDVIIGPRSALFVPFQNLGLIILDEEHEGSYKNEKTPCYHAREVAIERARSCGAYVVLGSATPSVESYYRTRTGEYTLLQLKNRAGQSLLPLVETVDLRKEFQEGNSSMFSRRLKFLIQDRLDKKEQIVLFLNRRGYISNVTCRSCGKPLMCPHCDVALTSHKNGKMICHYCGYQTPAIRSCPACGSRYIGGFKLGTQKVEESIRQIFPGIRTLRMDYDTTRKKGEQEKILSEFQKGMADVLIGTQMIIKGHDFKRVTLAGILLADVSLHSGDYRSAEKTFQILVQAAGRAGRGERPGQVIIQTYQPDHYSITASKKQDYEAFYEQEIQFRRALGYPPAEQLLMVLVSSASKEKSEIYAGFLMKRAEAKHRGECIFLGPSPAYVAKVDDIYKTVFYIKSGEHEKIVEIKDEMEQIIREEEEIRASCNIQFDFNPMNLL